MMWNDGNGHWDGMHEQAGTSGWLMVLLMLLVVIAAVVATVALVRGTVPAARTPRALAPDPRAILRQRFARGEIDEQDLRGRIRALDETDG